MQSWFQLHKPAVDRWVHHLLAALMWTVVGSVLLAVGCHWTLLTFHPAILHGSMLPRSVLLPAALIALGLVAGAAKAHWALRPVAERITRRIRERGDGRCIGGFLSWRSWAFVLVMIVAGRLLRSTHLPRAVLGVVYLAVGTALLLGSTRLWQACFAARRE